MIDLEPACTATASLVADLDDDRLDDATPCAAYVAGRSTVPGGRARRGARSPVSTVPIRRMRPGSGRIARYRLV